MFPVVDGPVNPKFLQSPGAFAMSIIFSCGRCGLAPSGGSTPSLATFGGRRSNRRFEVRPHLRGNQPVPDVGRVVRHQGPRQVVCPVYPAPARRFYTVAVGYGHAVPSGGAQIQFNRQQEKDHQSLTITLSLKQSKFNYDSSPSSPSSPSLTTTSPCLGYPEEATSD